MDVRSADGRWSVIEDIQQRRSKAKPGSREEDIYERALDLGLNPGRAVQNPAHLHRDVLRNAAYSHDRSVRRARIALEKYSAGLGVCCIDGALDAPFLDDVEDLAVGNDLRRHLRAVAADLGIRSLEFLDHWFGGCSVTEAGAAAGMSRATAYRTFAILKDAAIEWASPQAA